MGQIVINGLNVFGHHGVYEQEKSNGQNFIVNIVADTSFEEAQKSDDLSKTIDYGTMCIFIKKYFEEHAYDLLEKAANELALELIYTFTGIDNLTLEVLKPDAPISAEFENVGVRLNKKWTKVAIALGSNMGDKSRYLDEAMEKLLEYPQIRNLVVSDYIETSPYGYTNQEDFLNGAAIFETILSPMELLELLNKLENEAGRTREIHWGPRTLDLDILLYGDAVIDSRELTVPHIDMCNRGFVLAPLNLIAPGMVHPVRRRTIRDLYNQLAETTNKEEKC